jgi:nucleotide-binding universal stress UspA family protein
MYGSTAGHLLHTSRIPLLVVGKNVADAEAGHYAPKHLLVPLDGSKLAEVALPHARALADAFSTRVSLIRVAPFAVEAYPMTVPQMYWPDVDKALLDGARAYMDRVCAQFGRPVDLHVMQGPRSEALLDFTEKQAVDLVVMSTHARAGVQRAVLGSTADRMLGGPAPVFLVRPDE